MLRCSMLALALGVGVSGCYSSHSRDDAAARFDASLPRLDARTPRVDARTPRVDADPPGADAGLGCPFECSEHVVTWRDDGGLVPERATYQLSPCGRLFRRIERFDGSPEVCVIPVASHWCDTPGIMNLLIASDVIGALRGEAPILLGVDQRPVDGTVLQITIDGDTITVGSDCAGASGCVPVPEPLENLVAELRSLEMFFASADDACPPGIPATFECGPGGALECLSGREVCYLDGFDAPPRCAAPGPDECAGPPSCDCVEYNAFVTVCVEDDPGEVTLEHVGP